MIKKTITILIVILVAGIIIALVAARFWSGGGSVTGEGGTTAKETSTILPGAPPGLDIPPGDTIQIGTPHGTVTVKNFYKNITAYEDEFVIIAKTADYQITYDTIRSAFYIGIFGSSAAAARVEGEQVLLGLLGVSQTDACKLSVAESRQTGLSFCPGTASR